MVVLWIGTVTPRLLFAQENEDTHIQSDTMTAQSKKRRAIFRGNVVLTQGELVVHSDLMIVWWKPSPETSKEPPAEEQEGTNSRNKIEKIVAKGKVVIIKPTGRATSRQAIYFKDEEKIVLTGSPIAWQEGTRVSGTKMTMYLKEDRSEVEGGTRVIMKDEEGG
ncbi:MAG: hypothetical protein NPIRA04_18100 [Nitrospirales bacterium]|nr:MAG: hypothetical protein NPIRA04_18100 [Nitrospirales bacterium]